MNQVMTLACIELTMQVHDAVTRTTCTNHVRASFTLPDLLISGSATFNFCLYLATIQYYKLRLLKKLKENMLDRKQS